MNSITGLMNRIKRLEQERSGGRTSITVSFAHEPYIVTRNGQEQEVSREEWLEWCAQRGEQVIEVNWDG